MAREPCTSGGPARGGAAVPYWRLLAVTTLAGCGGYTNKSLFPEDIKSVYV